MLLNGYFLHFALTGIMSQSNLARMVEEIHDYVSVLNFIVSMGLCYISFVFRTVFRTKDYVPVLICLKQGIVSYF